jgi:integrase
MAGKLHRCAPEHFVFPTERVSGRGGRRTISEVDPTQPIGSLKTAFHIGLRNSGVKCRWHDLRHSFASHVGEGGAEQTLLALCGWMSRKCWSVILTPGWRPNVSPSTHSMRSMMGWAQSLAQSSDLNRPFCCKLLIFVVRPERFELPTY